MKKYLYVFIYAFLMSFAVHVQAEEGAVKAAIPVEEIILQQCTDGTLGVKFLCNPDWSLETDENAILVVISEDPAVLFTVAKVETPLAFVEELNGEQLKQMGQYADEFSTQLIQLAGHDALKVEGFSEKYPSIRLRDYYVIQGNVLYSFLFSVDPRELFNKYSPLFEKIISSVEVMAEKEAKEGG